MTFDSSPPLRGKRTGWLSGLLGRTGRGRLSRASDLPPRLLEDIGVRPDVVEDFFLRHRR